MSVAKHEALLNKITLMAQENRLHEIKDINQSFKTGFHVSGEKSDRYVTTLLGLAAYEADVFLVNALLEAGANVSTTMTGYRQLYTPLHLAIYGAYYRKNEDKALDDRIKIIDLLHKHGADLEWTGDGLYSWTPLATASYHSLPTLYSKLLRLGADPYKPSSAGHYTDKEHFINSKAFLEIACEEAQKKYQSDYEYKLPKDLHRNVIDLLQTLKFQYSTEESHLIIAETTGFNYPDSTKKYYESAFNEICSAAIAEPSHNALFDLSEVKYSGSLAIEDILDSL